MGAEIIFEAKYKRSYLEFQDVRIFTKIILQEPTLSKQLSIRLACEPTRWPYSL